MRIEAGVLVQRQESGQRGHERQVCALASRQAGEVPLGEWFVARSKPRAERLAAAALEARGLRPFLPEWRRQRRGRTDRREPLFPGYLFVHTGGQVDAVLRARSAPNVVCLLGSQRGPEPVPADVVEAIRARIERENTERQGVPFLPGQKVRIRHGPLSALDAVFDESLSGGQRARVFVQVLHRLVPVLLETDMLRLVG